MPLEKSDYRPILVNIKEMFPDKQVLSIKETSQVTGKSRDWVRRYIRFGVGNTVHVESLAEQLCAETESEAKKRHKQEELVKTIRGATYGETKRAAENVF